MESDSKASAEARPPLAPALDLAAVRDDLAQVEALEDEVLRRRAHLRAILPPPLFRLVWALLDAQEQLGLADQILVERAAAIRAGAGRRRHERSTPADAR